MAEPAKLSQRPEFRDLFQHLDEIALWTVTEQGEFDYISPGFEDIWGIAPEEVRADTSRLIESVHPADRDRVVDLVQRPEGEVAPDGVEHRIVRPDGSLRWVEARLFPVRDEAGAVTEVVGMTIDVTERRRRQEELEVLNRVLRHDIRNDMTVVLGWLDALAEVVPPDERDALDRIERASEHVVELTEIAREYVDVVVGDAEFALEPTDRSSVLAVELDARLEMYPDATFETAGEIPAVDVAANDLLGSVFRNLLNNAVQHNDGTDPTVAVSVSVEADSVRVCIADDGRGVPDAQKEAIFGKGESTLESPGTGMGLYLSREVVTAYGGDIWVEDNDPEGGVFCVDLPRAE